MSLFNLIEYIEIDLISDLYEKHFPLLKVWFLVFVAESADFLKIWGRYKDIHAGHNLCEC